MGVFQAAPGCTAFDTRDPAGRELIVAADLSAANESGRTEADRVSEHVRRPVLADDAADVAEPVQENSTGAAAIAGGALTGRSAANDGVAATSATMVAAKKI